MASNHICKYYSTKYPFILLGGKKIVKIKHIAQGHIHDPYSLINLNSENIIILYFIKISLDRV